MNDAPADYVKLAPARHPPRAAASTPEGRAWRRYRDPLVTKLVSSWKFSALSWFFFQCFLSTAARSADG